MAGLEITGNPETTNNNNRGNSNRNNDSTRRGKVDEDYQSLTDLLRPRLGSKAIGPRAELINKWINLSAGEAMDLMKEYNVRIGSVSREQGHKVKYPGIIISLNKKGGSRVSAHVLLIHDGVELEPKGKRSYYRSEDITPFPVPSLIWDSEYEDEVKREIVQMYSEDNREFKAITSVEFASMGCTVIPSTMHIAAFGDKPTNDDNPLDGLFVNVVESLSSFDRFCDSDKSLVRLGKSFNSKFQMISANVDQVPAVEFDLVGQPRRSDFCISLAVKRRRDDRRDNNNQNDSYNQEEDSDSGTILRVTGYVLPYYTEIDLDKRKPQNFGINIIVTDISGESTPSPELFLYGLASVSALTSHDMWVDGFKPSIISGTPNRNLGGLFLEIPDKDNVAMARREYAISAVDDLLEDVDFLFSDQIKISIDCSDSGPLAWITDLIVFNEVNNLYEAADNLTDDEFSKISSGVYPAIERNETRRFYVGTAETENGPVDIREVDYLYLINAFGDHASLDYAKLWDLSIADDTIEGLYKRRTMLDEVYGHGSYKITGQVDRVVIDSRFYTDLVDALEDIDMLPSFDNYSKNHRPKARLEAKDVHGTMSSKDLSSAYKGSSNRGFSRGRSGYRSRD